MNYRFFATATRGVADLLAAELAEFNALDAKISPAGVSFSGTLETGYRACLWSRVGTRVLVHVHAGKATDYAELYDVVREVDWRDHFGAGSSFAVDFHSTQSTMTHSQFGAQKVKDAIVDQFRADSGMRPTVDLDEPEVRVNVFVDRDQAWVAIDLAGHSLHKRGYRLEGAAAPLKENLAAAILLRAGWPAICAQGGDLVDPMCGSGTFLIEAAMLATDTAPGLLRAARGLGGWRGHDLELWARLVQEARERRAVGSANCRSRMSGFDVDRDAISAARTNLARADLQAFVTVEVGDALAARPSASSGLWVANPPYGTRLGEASELPGLMLALGESLRTHFQGWRAAILTPDPELGFRLGIRARKPSPFFNGALPVSLLRLDVAPENFLSGGGQSLDARQRRLFTLLRSGRRALEGDPAHMLANRLRKNLRVLGRWARRENVSCYRVYDADLPEYALAVDLYQADELWAHVQEYEAPSSIPEELAEARLALGLAVVETVLEVPPRRIALKVRRKQRGSSQYERDEDLGGELEVSEGGCRFLVNLTSYLDTGLFLDHRLTRAEIAKSAADKTFLNLFAYTATATVYAVRGGARRTTSVDLSNTYLDWAARNFQRNGIFDLDRHELVQADCLEWVRAAVRTGQRYELIFLDPPTFTNSKRMRGNFDVQRDHAELIGQVARLLTRDGELIFSTNRQRFRLARDELPFAEVRDITPFTIPADFQRHARVHRCWRMSGVSR